jgi:hypothetical protein
MVALNVHGLLHVTHAALPHLVRVPVLGPGSAGQFTAAFDAVLADAGAEVVAGGQTSTECQHPA